MDTPDFIFTNHGSLWLLEAQTRTARAHLREHVQHDAQWFGNRLVVEPRYVENLVYLLNDAGFEVSL